MKLDENFNQQEFTDWIEDFLPDFSRNIRKVDVPSGFTGVKSINTLGESSLNVRVYIIETEADPSKRKVGLATDSFNLLKNYGSPNAIIAYYSEDEPLWRISLLTSTPVWSEGKIITKLSNPKRQSYVLGSKAKVKTPHQYLLSKGKVIDFADLKSRFSLEVVNKEFYKEISQAFIRLVGGTVTNGKSKKSFESLLKLPSLQDRSQANLEFAVRLIGRIIFCWFLREKRSPSGNSLIPKELVSFEAVNTTEDYYHKILEPIFFEILNKTVKSRKPSFINDLFSSIPYLNGGLFSPHEDDFFNYNEEKQAINHNTVVIPDEWLQSFFEVLETYNFTIDENTSFDEELSIDPEMLGRIFENLLAEINPETGESARKSTGSYYTPRIIVDYMIDESLLLYLKEKAGIEENKLRSLISYDLEDDKSNPLNEDEKDKIAQALGLIKILDPACGSGAFPIGVLQKIVFILQQIDENGQLWFKKQIQNTPVELRKVMEREFHEKNFDYIRKLGIIRENIYGIDIQPIATEIARLRCFLTLVVDERVNDDEENRGIEPLPNLDFKFVTANSLIRLPNSQVNSQVGLFEDQEGINKLKDVRDLYFNASGNEREQLKLQFVQTQNKMFQKMIQEHTLAELTQKLSTWDPFGHDASDWFDPDWMFGIKDGFDVVIANPPYITISLGKGQNNFKEDEVKKLNSIYKDVNEYKNNTFVYFIRLAMELLGKNGQIDYIVPNVLLYNKNFSKIRNLLLEKTQLEIIIDVKDKVFESAEIGGNCILLSSNKQSDSYTVRTCVVREMKDFEKIEYEKIESNIYRKTKYNKFFLEKIKLELLEKLHRDSLLLGSLTQFYNGIKTGNNSKFLSSEKINDSYKLVYRGRDIHKYSFDKPSTYVLFDRAKLWSNSNEELLGKIPKILIRQTSDSLIAALEEEGIYHMDTTHSIFNSKLNILFLLCLLNSRLLDWWHKNYTSEEGRTFAEVKISSLKEIPIKNTNKDAQQPFIEIIEKVLAITKSNDYLENSTKKEKVKEYEKQVDRLVYKLYGLTSEEITIVEGNNEDN